MAPTVTVAAVDARRALGDNARLWPPGHEPILSVSPSVTAFNGFSFDELQTPAGLARLDARFRERLAAADPTLVERLDALR